MHRWDRPSIGITLPNLVGRHADYAAEATLLRAGRQERARSAGATIPMTWQNEATAQLAVVVKIGDSIPPPLAISRCATFTALRMAA